MFAVDAVNAPAVLMIDPAVAVMPTAPAAEELVTSALAPKYTLRPEDTVIVPEEEVTLEAMVISLIAK